MASEVSRLSQIQTPWSLLRRAHDSSGDSLEWARQELLHRYEGAVRRYLRAMLRDDEAADDIFQEFALRLVKGSFHTVDPQRGRFRSFVKTTLHNLVVDFRRKSSRDQGWSLQELASPLAGQEELPDDLFIKSWSQELLDRSWARLYEIEREGGTVYYSALRLLVDNPRLSSKEVAAKLSSEPGREITAGHVRVIIHRARQLFADQLVTEVAASVYPHSAEEIENELGELHLLQYCRNAFARQFPEPVAAPGDQESLHS